MVELSHKILGTVGAPKEPEAQKPQMNDLDLQSLIELGCIRDIVQIDNLTFVMRSLNAAERIELSNAAVEENIDKVFAFNAKLLAMSIETVNGRPLESFHPSNASDNAGTLGLKVDIIMSMQTPVISRLLSFYQEITERCDKQFTVEQVKN